MPDAIQVQRRRGTASQCDAMTPAEGEIIVDTTNDRLRLGDGTTMGGVHQASAFDVRTQAFNRGTVGGTANAITVSLSPAIESYAAGLKIGFVAPGTNTGSTTINIDGVGAVTIQKVKDGSIADLESGDLVNGGYYEVVRVGSVFQLMSSGGGASGVWEQISSGTITNSSTSFNISVPSGYNSYELIIEDLGFGGTTISMVSPVNRFLRTGSGDVPVIKMTIYGSDLYQMVEVTGGQGDPFSPTRNDPAASSSRVSTVTISSFANLNGGTYKLYGRK